MLKFGGAYNIYRNGEPKVIIARPFLRLNNLCPSSAQRRLLFDPIVNEHMYGLYITAILMQRRHHRRSANLSLRPPLIGTRRQLDESVPAQTLPLFCTEFLEKINLILFNNADLTINNYGYY